MKYFCRNHDRRGTCYHEFIGGPWDGKTFWSDDSICLHDEIFDDYPDFRTAWLIGFPEFETFGINRLTPEHWERIRRSAEEKGGAAWEIVSEIDNWMRETLASHGFITILGI